MITNLNASLTKSLATKILVSYFPNYYFDYLYQFLNPSGKQDQKLVISITEYLLFQIYI